MAKQERAIRTRRRILEAAALVFEREGYQGATITEILRAAGVTKGALYFHFPSKEELARNILLEQRKDLTVPQQPFRLQEMIDTGMLLTERLRTDALVRASVRLTLDQQARDLDRRGPFRAWSEHNLALLEAARLQGELMPHVNPAEVAELCVGSFAGLQMMSQAMSDYRDLPQRLSVFLHHVMVAVAVPAVLVNLDLSPARARLVAEASRAARETAPGTDPAAPPADEDVRGATPPGPAEEAAVAGVAAPAGNALPSLVPAQRTPARAG
ncbi:ScbR family autoregulator-binding transcription factor [Streptomyces sp. DSM 44917]|uniref:ScbR family autoregulator-binding transcription factor n=1 Tax=Streptomyces boetiae TaxID=3075541 RepID=A0ABU2L8T0_9ACTN|nr:ScbR family autoregulator-binding transcription factor [Streptomyces sp. DSM 44917]MDT0307905.1 ScbR family autoregulator-binding transcription factor [Streptomyces sp. DSM 44917]